MFHFFAHKFARLRAGRFALTRILARAFDGIFFWHNKDVSPLVRGLDVKIPPDAALVRDECYVALGKHRKRHKTVAISPDTKLLSAMRTIVLLILLILLIGALPTWPYSSGWGYYPSGGLGLLLVIVLILWLLRRI